MTPLKKPLQFSASAQPTITLHDFFQRMLKKENSAISKVLSKKEQPEIFFALAEDIPSEIQASLLRSRKGISHSPDEDLLKHLLKLERENHRLKSLSITDELTGLYNKRFFNKQLKIEMTRTKRTGQPFCLLFIDLDNFKSINDNLGHTKGDEFLMALCHLISRKTRPTDFACRYGGDEFTIIMPATSLLDGISIAQRWHDLIEQVARKMEVNVSSSIGIDEFDSVNILTAEEFLDKVDKELYNAKKTGKNKVSYPGLAQSSTADARSVTQAEKDALYKAAVPLTQKRKSLSTKG